MNKVSDIVKTIVDDSEIASSALNEGILNLSAYAKNIHAQVEKRAMKPVKQGTIVAALARYSKEAVEPFAPEVSLRDISVKSRLTEIAFEQSTSNRERIRRLYQSEMFKEADFLTITHGVRELSIIVSDSLTNDLMKIFEGESPRIKIGNLCGLTVSFDSHYIHEPGQTFALVRKLAIKRINIVEIVSTFTELTFILDDKDIELALLQFAKELGRGV